MNDSTFEYSYLMKLECGCTINKTSGELLQECVPHQQANFIK